MIKTTYSKIKTIIQFTFLLAALAQALFGWVYLIKESIQLLTEAYARRKK